MHPALILNAAFDALIQNNDSEAVNARTVITYGAKLRRQRNFELILSFPWNNRDSFIGTTNELGNINQNEEKKEVKEIGLLVKKERIGNYRIWKSAEGHLQFHRYWTSDITTQTDATPKTNVFHLFYNPTTLSPIAFAEEYQDSSKEIRLFRNNFRWTILKLHVFYGEVPLRYRRRVKNRSV